KRRKPESLTGSPAKRDGADAGQRADAAQVSEKRKWPAGRPAGSDRIALLRLKKALEAKDTIAIDLALDELLPMTLGNAQKKMLSEIWDYVIAADFKNAAVLVDKQLSASSEKRRKTAVAG
ncbi:MAG: hypothetical protein LBQ57_01730, partial [Spirochaetales bacterium]|nr:hypothetical protein [Spirochaetales bacterium]